METARLLYYYFFFFTEKKYNALDYTCFNLFFFFLQNDWIQYSYVESLNCPSKNCCCRSVYCMLVRASFLYHVSLKHLTANRRRENDTLHLTHEDTMLLGCNLSSASISASLLKNFLVHLLIPPAIVNTRGVKDACSASSIFTTTTTTTDSSFGFLSLIM